MKKYSKKQLFITMVPIMLGLNLLNNRVSAEEINDNEVDNLNSHLNNDALISETTLDMDAKALENIEVTTSSITREHVNGIYTVVKGDTFYSIANSFGLTQTQLRVWNNLSTIPTNLSIGTKFAVTTKGVESNLSANEKAKLIEYGRPLTYHSAEEMIRSLAPVAVEVANQSGEEKLWPSLMLAQAIHETGVEAGMSDKSRAPYHVLMGLKARGSVTSILDWTWEEVTVGDQTEKIRVLAEFQSFDSYPAAVQGYADRLRYGPGWDDQFYAGTWVSNSSSVWDVLDNGGLKGYATDGIYVSKIKEKINKYNLTQYDRMVTRISGSTRFDTAVDISKDGWATTDTVILANSHNFADALAGVPLASGMDAPILLTRENQLEQSTIDEIRRLNAKNVVILGGEKAISTSVEASLKQMAVGVKRLSGETRYQTSDIIAKELDKQSNVTQGVIVSGENFVDAMSVASFAAQNNIPIYLTRKDALTDEIREAAETIKKWTIIGGPSAVQTTVETELTQLGSTITRIYGSDRYETNQKVISHFGTNKNHTYISTGRNYIDALTGAVLAAKNNTGILLLENRQDIIDRSMEYVRSNTYNHFTILGGEKILPNHIANSLKNYNSSSK